MGTRAGRTGMGALSGFGIDLGMSMTGLSRGSFEDFLYAATSLSLVRRVPRSMRPDGAWSVHPLLAEFLRADLPRGEVDARIQAWVVEQGDSGAGARATRWATLSRESAAVHSWLASVDDATVSQFLPRCWEYATSHGPVGPWLAVARRACDSQREHRGPLAWALAQLASRVGAHDEVLRAALVLATDGDGERDVALAAGLRADILQARGALDEALRILREDALPVFERLGDVRSKAATMGKIADILQDRGDLDEALRIRREDELPVYEHLGDVREQAVTMGQIADILQDRGDLDEALRIHREDELPVYERLGDVRAKALTMGKIADILQVRGDLDEALRIRREDELPVYERLGDVQAKAVTMGQIADILQARGDLDEALRIRRDDALPVFEQLGDVRSKAVTMGRIADILQTRGDLDGALRIRRDDTLPVFERLGDVRSKAVTMGQIADILQARGDLDESLRIRREDVLPIYERQGGRDLLVGLANLGSCLIQRGGAEDLAEARSHLERAAGMAQLMRIPFPEWLLQWLASSASRA